METPNPQPPQNQPVHPHQNPLPNATVILILGIASIVLSIWYLSLMGFILSIVTLVMANRDQANYFEHPGKFTSQSYRQVKTGKILAVIGLVLSIFFFALIMLTIFGVLVTLPFMGMID
jgi:uncharacterized membrane protein YidH (DUF202 family)